MTYRSRHIGLIALVLISFAAQSAMYKWVDEDGNIHYSDENPAEKSESVEAIERSSSTKRLTPYKKFKQIIRSPGVSAEPIYLNEIRYIWNRPSEANKSRKVGAYHLGKDCKPRGAIKMPRASSVQIGFFSDEKDMTRHAHRIIQKMDYPLTLVSDIRDASILRDVKQSGLILDGEIVVMDYKACALGVENLERYGSAEQIPYREFMKHRLRIEIRWVLKRGSEGPVIFEATGIGDYSNWKTGSSGGLSINQPPGQAFKFAMNKATMALYSDREFVGKITSQ